MKLSTIGGLMIAVAACMPLAALAVTTKATIYVFYSGTQAVGQSILYCDNQTQHWGDASQHNLGNAVSVTYSCDTDMATYVGYPAAIDPWVKTNFCGSTGICDGGPNPIIGAPATQRGLWSD